MAFLFPRLCPDKPLALWSGSETVGRAQIRGYFRLSEKLHRRLRKAQAQESKNARIPAIFLFPLPFLTLVSFDAVFFVFRILLDCRFSHLLLVLSLPIP